MKLLKTLSETPGAPGREERVRDLIRERVAPFVDSIEIDALGSRVAFYPLGKLGSDTVTAGS